ncbi:MAG TPA: pyruvate kinase [Coriobacteriia bacterium]|jgi:pyruvate kinase
MRHTKIVATIGPASGTPEVLDAMLAAGVDVARLNASHGDPSTLAPALDAVRAAAARAGREIAVMLDLGGPKLRIGAMPEGVVLSPGQRFELLGRSCTGGTDHACLTYDLAQDLHAGDTVLLNDGAIQLCVREISGDRVITEVEVGGPLTSQKGVNVPGVTLGLETITEKDRRDLAWGLEAGVDLVALSFVRSAEDVARLRELMGARRVPIVAKVEKHEAVDRMDDIVAISDVVMVARGDLGVETSPEAVPVIQRRLIETCRERGKPVIIATQMLESMISAPRPTRAEASDVANAIFSGADAVMLSGETAVGQYPAEVVRTMARIAVTAESSMEFSSPPEAHRHSADVTEAVSAAVVELADDLGVRAIITSTQSGSTALSVAKYRPSAPIVAITPSVEVARRLRVAWGVQPVTVRASKSIEDMIALAVDAAREQRLVDAGDLVAITAGVAVNQPGSTNLIQVRTVT